MHKYKKLSLLFLGVILLFFMAEVVNYLSKPNSPSGAFIVRELIKKSVRNAKTGDFHKTMHYIGLASKVNIVGEYGISKKNIPNHLNDPVQFADDPIFRKNIVSYIASLNDSHLIKARDQGLGKIYYNMALIAYSLGQDNMTLQFLRNSLYSNHEYPPFHVELINYYYSKNMMDDVKEQLVYCRKFDWAKTLCDTYEKDREVELSPREVGHMKNEIENYYLVE